MKRIDKPELFRIDAAVKTRYPSVSIGIALIRGVSIQKGSEALETEKREFLATLTGLTTEQLGLYPEIVSYRKFYKEMGIDWHSLAALSLKLCFVGLRWGRDYIPLIHVLTHIIW